jgi:hypothetical protein
MKTHTHIGIAIITHRNLVTLSSDKWGTSGSIALGILLDRNDKVQNFCLLWEWGGDWMGFSEADAYDLECLEGWEPDKVEEAVAEAIRVCESCESDMQWYTDWADIARETLK